jgi:hypothetical protein
MHEDRIGAGRFGEQLCRDLGGGRTVVLRENGGCRLVDDAPAPAFISYNVKSQPQLPFPGAPAPDQGSTE